MRIVAVSDLHGHLPRIPECDILLIPGDIEHHKLHDSLMQQWLIGTFWPWLQEAPARYKVGCAGNHDWLAYHNPSLYRRLPWRYLKDEAIVIEGLTIYGSPWTPTFHNWAFMKDDPLLEKTWKKIPDNVDILMTHGPARSIRDLTKNKVTVGSLTLRKELMKGRFENLSLHVFGHIHEDPGAETIGNVLHANVTLVNANYRPVNPPWVFEENENLADGGPRWRIAGRPPEEKRISEKIGLPDHLLPKHLREQTREDLA